MKRQSVTNEKRRVSADKLNIVYWPFSRFSELKTLIYGGHETIVLNYEIRWTNLGGFAIQFPKSSRTNVRAMFSFETFG